jgi:hypothetical protein
MNEIKVGGDTEAYCTTCKSMKDHVIVAMVGGKPAKVECAGCHKQHVYRAGPPGAPKPKAASTSRRVAAVAVPKGPSSDELEAQLAGRAADAQPYSPAARYSVGDAIKHPTFGVGVVTALPAAQKADVAFRGGSKLLIHDRGSIQASTLERPRPREDDGRTPVTDAPHTSK